MLKNSSFLAIIPARGGSKRLPNKNLLNFADKPLISQTISSSLKSKYIDKTIVSTDSELIKKTAINCGAEVPFIRPDSLSDDYATRDEVIKHSINFVQMHVQENFDYVVYLQPTSPLRDEIHIDSAIEYLFEKEADSVVSVCEVEYPVEWTGILPDDRSMQDLMINEYLQSRSQDFPLRHRLNGAIYICNIRKFLEASTVFLKENIFAYIMPREASIDIDEEIDFMFARTMLENKS